MLKQLLKIAANQFLAQRRARTGSGPRRMPPTSANEFRNRAAQGAIRWVMSKFMKR